MVNRLLILYCMHDCLSYLMTPFHMLEQRLNIDNASEKSSELFIQKVNFRTHTLSINWFVCLFIYQTESAEFALPPLRRTMIRVCGCDARARE